MKLKDILLCCFGQSPTYSEVGPPSNHQNGSLGSNDVADSDMSGLASPVLKRKEMLEFNDYQDIDLHVPEEGLIVDIGDVALKLQAEPEEHIYEFVEFPPENETMYGVVVSRTSHKDKGLHFDAYPAPQTEATQPPLPKRPKKNHQRSHQVRFHVNPPSTKVDGSVSHYSSVSYGGTI